MKKQKISAVNAYQQRQCKVLVQMCQMLRISQEQYTNTQLEVGNQYIQLMLGDAFMENQIVRNKLYWNWFKNEWLLREEDFLASCPYSHYSINQFGNLQYTPINYLSSWQMLHNPYNLVSLFEPQGKKMHTSYAQFIGKIIDQSTIK